MKEAVDAFDAALRDDLNTAAGLGAMFDLIRALNISMDTKQVGKGDAPEIIAAFNHFDRVLGVLSLRRAEDATPPIPQAEIDAAIQARQDARRRRDFGEADRIRQDLARQGRDPRRRPAGDSLEAEIAVSEAHFRPHLDRL